MEAEVTNFFFHCIKLEVETALKNARNVSTGPKDFLDTIFGLRSNNSKNYINAFFLVVPYFCSAAFASIYMQNSLSALSNYR